MIKALLVIMLVSSVCFAEEFSQDITCYGNKCFPKNSPKAMENIQNRLNASQRNALGLLNKTRELLSKAEMKKEVSDDFLKMKEQLEQLEKNLLSLQEGLNKLNSRNEDSKEFTKHNLMLLSNNLSKLENDINEINEELTNKVDKLNELMKKQAVGFGVGSYGLFTSLGNAVGGNLEVDVPVGYEGLWHLGVSLGIGLGHKSGVGMLYGLSLNRELNNIIQLGGHILYATDKGNLKSYQKEYFIAGGGVDVKLTINKWFSLTLSPFVGFGNEFEVGYGLNVIGMASKSFAQTCPFSDEGGPVDQWTGEWTHEDEKMEVVGGLTVGVGFDLL